MQPRSLQFKANAGAALRESNLQAALKQLELGFVAGRATCYQNLPEFEALRERAEQVLNHTLENLDHYLCEYEQRVIEAGGQVHWASTPAEAQEIVLGICREADARSVIRGKSNTRSVSSARTASTIFKWDWATSLLANRLCNSIISENMGTSQLSSRAC